MISDIYEKQIEKTETNAIKTSNYKLLEHQDFIQYIAKTPSEMYIYIDK